MSYDVSMEVDTGNGNFITVEDLGNCTYNLAPMFREALGGGGMRDLDGQTGEQVSDRLWTALRDIVTRKEFYEEMNPSNGWGDYHDAVHQIVLIAFACVRYPKAIIRIS